MGKCPRLDVSSGRGNVTRCVYAPGLTWENRKMSKHMTVTEGGKREVPKDKPWCVGGWVLEALKGSVDQQFLLYATLSTQGQC